MLIFVGDGDVILQLKRKVSEENLFDKVMFFGKRSYQDLMNFTILSDVGVSMDKDTNVNYRYSLPNKIFDFIHAGIPLLVSNLKEVKNIVKKFQVGLICPNHEIEEIAIHLDLLLNDEKLREKCIANTKIAAKQLTWEGECKVLKTIF